MSWVQQITKLLESVGSGLLTVAVGTGEVSRDAAPDIMAGSGMDIYYRMRKKEFIQHVGWQLLFWSKHSMR